MPRHAGSSAGRALSSPAGWGWQATYAGMSALMGISHRHHVLGAGARGIAMRAWRQAQAVRRMVRRSGDRAFRRIS